MESLGRQIFVHGLYGERQLRETLSDLLVGLVLSPDAVWLVSPWVSDFDVLDNRSGDWSTVHPAWGARYVMFSELLAVGIEGGCDLKLVTNNDEANKGFYEKLIKNLTEKDRVRWIVEEQLHTKGLLCSSFFLAGSMNFTYSGINRNDEHVRLSIDSDEISEAKMEFERRYAR
jgi:PLD-like domain